MDCFHWIRKETETAPFPKAKEYQKLKVGAYDQEESEIDLYTTDEGESPDEESDSENEEDNQD